jgi:hypothetical protein
MGMDFWRPSAKKNDVIIGLRFYQSVAISMTEYGAAAAAAATTATANRTCKIPEQTTARGKLAQTIASMFVALSQFDLYNSVPTQRPLLRRESFHSKTLAGT